MATLKTCKFLRINPNLNKATLLSCAQRWQTLVHEGPHISLQANANVLAIYRVAHSAPEEPLIESPSILAADQIPVCLGAPRRRWGVASRCWSENNITLRDTIEQLRLLVL